MNRIGHLFLPLFAILAEGWKQLNEEQIYCLDTLQYLTRGGSKSEKLPSINKY